MPAVLHIAGQEFDPERLPQLGALRPDQTWCKGKPMFPASKPEGSRHDNSGITLFVSDADFDDFPRQVEEAIAFLDAHKDDLRLLRDAPGVEEMFLDFGISRRDVIVHCDYLPSTLLRSAGELGIGIAISHYPASEAIQID
jgi:hypothetical protein